MASTDVGSARLHAYRERPGDGANGRDVEWSFARHTICHRAV